MNEEVTVAMAAVGERKAVWRAVAMREKKEERAGEREREREREWRTGVVYGFFKSVFFWSLRVSETWKMRSTVGIQSDEIGV